MIEDCGVQEGLLGVTEPNAWPVQGEGDACLDVLRARIMAFSSFGSFADNPSLEVFSEGMGEGNVGKGEGSQWQ